MDYRLDYRKRNYVFLNILFLFMIALYPALSKASPTTIFIEDFEDNILDDRVQITTVGTFSNSPGIKETSNLSGQRAYGFGISTCSSNCFESYMTKFIITLDSPTYVSELSFKEMELYNNWGSMGHILIDGVDLGESQCGYWQEFGRCPVNDSQPDQVYRTKTVSINKVVQSIELKVADITNLSEIFVDDIRLSGRDPEQTDQVQKFGLFIGIRHDSTGVDPETGRKFDDMRGDLTVEIMKDSFSKLPNVVHAKPLTGKYEEGGVSKEQISEEISYIKSKIKDGDIFFLYIFAHGKFHDDGNELTLTPGDEYLAIGEGRELLDDDLLDLLSGMNNIKKWIFIDACYSAGFWGSDNFLDKGDLEKLPNISLIATAEEDKFSYFHAEGRSIGLNTIEEAFSRDSNGNFTADVTPFNGDVSFLELAAFVVDYADINKYKGKIVYEMAFGEPTVFSIDMYTPVHNKSADFSDETLINGSPIANAGGSYLIYSGSEVVLDASQSYDTDGNIISYSWDWDNNGIYDLKTTTPTILHAFNLKSGEIKTIRLLVEDDAGLTASSVAFVEKSQSKFHWPMFLPAIIGD